MRPSNKEYDEMTKRISPPSSKIKDFVFCLSYRRLYLRSGAASDRAVFLSRL